ncbi:MAG: LysR family transcriptional regulator [Burkholderiales bacterium]|nr:LysR family transcriptional regulator [Burkholderiales bacterium]
MHPRNANAAPAPALPRSRQLRLDLLQTFEAAARHLSFTRAGQELFLTQSAVSRQIQQLEASLGAELFERGHRKLALTEAGRVMQRAVDDSLERLRDAAARVRAPARSRQVAITCTPGFASFWLIPRLSRFTAGHAQVDVRVSATLEMVDLDRSDIDIAVRLVPSSSGKGPLLFEEHVQPLCSPKLLRDPRAPLASPADLARHTLLTVDLPSESMPALDWEPWLQLMGVEAVRPASTLRFTQYAEAVAAAVEGQGVVLGRLPLLERLVKQGKLVAPFRGSAASRRGYFVQTAAHAAHNPDAQDFLDWLLAEAAVNSRQRIAA